MKKIIALVSVFAVLMIAFSGCVGNNPAANGTDTDNPKTNSISDEDPAGISTLETLPAGFEYYDTVSLSTDDIQRSYEANLKMKTLQTISSPHTSLLSRH
jgi:hypothetical protein